MMLAGIPVIKKSKHRERKSMEDLKCSFHIDMLPPASKFFQCNSITTFNDEMIPHFS